MSKIIHADHKLRIDFLDGMRGIAILLVVGYHAYASWPKILPYGVQFSEFPLTQYGYLGVQLFFLISGFVILMTLEKTSGFSHFLCKRWVRLFPAMLACSAIIYLSSGMFYERPSGQPNLFDTLPGLLFLHPRILTFVIGEEVRFLEGAFWSLCVEVQFYIFFGAIYYIKGKKAALWGLFIAYMIAVVTFLVFKAFPDLTLSLPFVSKGFSFLLVFIGATHYGWFIGGALLYLYSHERKRNYAIYGAAVIVLSSIQQFDTGSVVRPGGVTAVLAAIFVGVIFIVPIISPVGRALLSARSFVFIGTVSYPLYLIHENMMVSMIIKLSLIAPWMPSVLLPILPILAIIIISWPIAIYFEPLVKKSIERLRFPSLKLVRSNIP